MSFNFFAYPVAHQIEASIPHMLIMSSPWMRQDPFTFVRINYLREMTYVY